MRKRIVIPILLILALSMSAIPVFAQGPRYVTDSLAGTQIVVWGPDITKPRDEEYFVVHGYGAPDWPNNDLYPSRERQRIMKSWFELEIDGEAVELTRWVRFIKYVVVFGTPRENAMFVLFYVEFEANHFEPGTLNSTDIGIGQMVLLPQNILEW